MRILISGSSGALGSILMRELRSQGHDVYGCDLLHTNDPQVMRADVSEHRQVERVFDFANPDMVYWFSAEFGRLNGRDYTEQLWKTNMIGTQNAIEECVLRDVTLAFSSSSEAYGLADRYAKGEKLHEGLLDEHSPTFHNSYALSKFCNEKQIITAANNDNLRAVIFRFFNIYGPNERFSPYRSVACQFMYRALTNQPITVYKDSLRSHLFVEDWVKTVSRLPDALDNILGLNSVWPGSAGSGIPVFNVGSDETVSNDDLLRKVLRLVETSRSNITRLPPEENNLAVKAADCTLAKTYLDHDPRTSLDEGLQITIEWIKRIYGI